MPRLVFVGGFLGAGKTTLIACAAERLAQRGLRVAAVMNDQDQGLVDTMFSQSRSLSTREVAGGCFCCRFSDFIDAAEQLESAAPDVIFAEPVGSCIDLSATIMQPLKASFSGRFELAPLTVLVDPAMAERAYSESGVDDTAYLFRNQIAEADILCLTKADVRMRPERLPVPVDFHLSARSGEGVDEWLDEVLHGGRVVGSRVLDVDYSRYAEAEAALGWVNVHSEIMLDVPASPACVAGPLLDELDRELTRAGSNIAHLKIFDRASSGYIKAGICSNGEEPVTDGDLPAEASLRHELVVNLRALADPELMRKIVRGALDGIPGRVLIRHEGAFRPSPPKPERTEFIRGNAG